MRCDMVHKDIIPDLYLYEIWDRMCDDGLDIITFYEGDITDHHAFRDFVRNEKTHFFALYYDKTLAGCIWLNSLYRKTGHCHFVFFRGKRATKIALARFAVSRIIRARGDDGEYMLDVIIGITPKRYRRAIEFIQKCGCVVCGEIPYGTWFADTQKSEDATLTTVTRESTEESWQNA